MIRIRDALGIASLAAGALSFFLVRYSLQDLEDSVVIKKSERLAVNIATCFLWPALVVSLLRATSQDLGPIAMVTCVAVLFYLCQEVRAVLPYSGLLDEYHGGDSLLDRSTQISTSAFAAGTILLSAGKDVTVTVTPCVFLALLLCVASAIPSTSVQKGGFDKHITWESMQKSSMSIAASLLALAISICIDAYLFSASRS